MKYKPSQIRKFIVAAIGAVATLLIAVPEALGSGLPNGAAAVTVSVVSVLTAIGVFLTRNADLIDRLDQFSDDD